MADVQLKRKIGVSPHARVTTTYPSRPSSPTKSTRSRSPLKRGEMKLTANSPELPRPRVKVTSSATVTVGKNPASSLSPGYASGSSTPRAPSPIRRHESQQRKLSSKPDATTLSRVRSTGLPTASTPTSPRIGNIRAEYAPLSATTSNSALAKPGPPRVRQASISSASQLSSTSSSAVNGVRSPPLSVVTYSQDSDAQSNVATQRITAKVSGLAKAKPQAQTCPSPSPLLMPSPALSSSASEDASSRAPQIHHRMGRTASIGSLSTSRSPQVYPITTASPAANIHRFATVRSPSSSFHPSQFFTSPLQAEHKPLHVDPALVPLPPLSPPVSNVSFSSRSSASRSSVSSASNTAAPDLNLNGNGAFKRPNDYGAIHCLDTRTTSPSNSVVIHDTELDRAGHGGSSELDFDGTGEDSAVKAEAKSHRKIADLEITTKSLLAINSQLEANKHKQAKEIRDLRRKLRESQLTLPPRAYRELKTSGAAEELDKEEDEPEELQIDGDEDARITTEAIKLGKDDELFDRVRLIIDSLLTTGREALARKVEDLAPSNGTAKVLHEVEARTWRVGVPETNSSRVSPAGGVAADYFSFDELALNACSGDEGVTSQMVRDDPHSDDHSRSSEREVEELVGNVWSSLPASISS